MKVIFLDVDGVLNEAFSKSRCPTGCIGVDDDKVELLKQIIDATEAKIVLTSTWKRTWSRNKDDCGRDALYLNNKLAKSGLKIADKTIDDSFDRGEGIANWLKAHPMFDTWIVLDDDIFSDYEQYGIIPRLVNTNFYTGGLTDKHVKEAIKLLNKESAN